MAKFTSVDDYLASLTLEQRAVVEQIEQRVLTVAPSAERVIRYNMPTRQLNGTSLVHAAAWKQHVSLYPVPPEGDPALDADLAPYAGAKGTLKLLLRQGRLRPHRAGRTATAPGALTEPRQHAAPGPRTLTPMQLS